MRKKIAKPLIIIILALLLICFWTPNVALAQSTPPNQFSVILIIDDSGSMKANDPNDLRYTAAKLFISTLDDGDEIGVIRFSTESKIISDLTRIENVNIKNDLIGNLNPVAADGYTDVKAAILSAETMLKNSQHSNNTVIILLTDGKPEIPDYYAEYDEETLMLAKKLNIPIYAIGLTKASQTAFLNLLTAETGGRVIPAETANDLLSGYLNILGELKDRTIVGEGEERAPKEKNILLDPALIPYLSKVSFVVSKDPGIQVKLFSPASQEILENNPNVEFFQNSDPGYSAFTINSPASGEWKFVLSGNGNAQVRAIFHSRLRSKIVSPSGNFETGKPILIVVNMIEEQLDGSSIKIVGQTSFSAVVTLPDGSQQSLDTFYDDGTYGDVATGDGNFTREFVDTGQPGKYNINVKGLKDVIPVSSSTQIFAIPFPGINIDEPSQLKYEIRGSSIPLRISLTGIEDNSYFEGGFDATITSPSGKTTTISLPREGNSFYGEFFPVENGTHSIKFESKSAFYQGLSFQKSIASIFESTIVNHISIQEIQIGSEESEKMFSINEAKNGLSLLIKVKSSSDKNERIFINTEGFPGFYLQEKDSHLIIPQSETEIKLRLIGGDQIKPSTVLGSLIFTPETTVDILNNRVDLQFETFEPSLSISSDVLSNCDEDKCWQWAPVRLILTINSTSRTPEVLDLRVEKLDKAQLSKTKINVLPGENNIELFLNPTEKFSPGSYEGELFISSESDSLKINNELPLPISFTVDPFWKSCKKPMIILGIIFLVVAIITTKIFKNIARAKLPPIITGTIKYEPIKPDAMYDLLGNLINDEPDNENGPRSSEDGINLTKFNKSEICIGSDSLCEVVIPDNSIQTKHVILKAEKRDKRIKMYLIPIGDVYKVNLNNDSYDKVSSRCELQHKDVYKIGNIQIKYFGHGIY